MKWATGPRDGHVGHQVEVGAVGRHQQRKEHVVLAFKGEDAVSTQRLKVACVFRDLPWRTLELQMHFHMGSSVGQDTGSRTPGAVRDGTPTARCLVTIGTSW